jgi:hypothetical protein
VISLHGVVTGTEVMEVKRQLQLMQPKVRTAVRRELGAIGAMMRDYIRSRKLQGQVLRKQTGKLWKSIGYSVTDSGNQLSVSIGTDARSDIKKTPIRTAGGRFTGKTKTSGGFPYGAYWETSGKNHGGPRPFLRPALDEKRQEIRKRIADASLRSALA